MAEDQPGPVLLGYASAAADSVELVWDPDDQDYVQSDRGFVEELRHDGLHSCECNGHLGEVVVVGGDDRKLQVEWCIPTEARMTVRNWAVGKLIDVLNSSIWSRSTEIEVSE